MKIHRHYNHHALAFARKMNDQFSMQLILSRESSEVYQVLTL